MEGVGDVHILPVLGNFILCNRADVIALHLLLLGSSKSGEAHQGPHLRFHVVSAAIDSHSVGRGGGLLGWR